MDGRKWVLVIAIGAGLGAATWTYFNVSSLAQNFNSRRAPRGTGGTAGGWLSDYQFMETDQLLELVKREPRNAPALAQLARQLAKAGRSDEAHAYAVEAIAILDEAAQTSQAQNVGTDVALGIALEAAGLYDEALRCYDRAVAQQQNICRREDSGDERRRRPRDWQTEWYNLGCYAALARQPDLAFEALNRAVELGWGGIRHMEADLDLDPVREDPRYAELLKVIEERGVVTGG